MMVCFEVIGAIPLPSKVDFAAVEAVAQLADALGKESLQFERSQIAILYCGQAAPEIVDSVIKTLETIRPIYPVAVNLVIDEERMSIELHP